MSLEEGLLLWVDFNQGLSLVEPDHSGNKFDGTVIGAERIAGRGCKVMKFDGSDDYMDFGDVIDFGATDSFSVSLWLKCYDKTHSSNNQRVVEKGNIDVVPAPGAEGWSIGWIYNQKIYIQLQDSDEEFITYWDNIITDYAWYHVIGVIDRTLDKAFLYVNGVERAQVGIATLGSLANTRTLRFGCYGSGTPVNFFKGELDDVRIWNRVLTQRERRMLY